jgi:hypothetical protein
MHGGCDPLTRRHAQASRPARLQQGRDQSPKGHGPHHYHFRLAALDVPRLAVSASAKAEDIRARAQPNIIAEVELVGVYER